MVTHKTSEVTITRIDVGKDQVHLSDGRVIDHPARSRKRSPKTGPSANLSTDPLARFSLILSNPESYRLFDHITIGTTSHGGVPWHLSASNVFTDLCPTKCIRITICHFPGPEI